ncbi:MAG TPA: zinc ribbon domain-containing protein [Gaiellaceae bacterium]
MAAPVPEERCPRCETPYSPGQEYCLECGSKLPARSGLVTRLGSGWKRRLGWYPGDWIWPALLALVIAAAAGAASALWLAPGSSANDQTVVATSPGASSLEQTQTAPEPTTTAPATVSTPTTAPAQFPPAPPAKALVPWPAGRSGWTIVLDSLPSANGRAPATAEAQQALHLGLRKVGVLDSAQFSSLHPGYFVVFFGIYASQAAAQSAIIDAHQKGYGGAYPRRITP